MVGTLRSGLPRLMAGKVVISPMATWPQSHPLNIPDSILKSALAEDVDGYPAWLNFNPTDGE